jgi:hypothetical protein
LLRNGFRLINGITFGGWQEDAINWHLALLYLGQKNNSKARKELEHIIVVGRDNVTKAGLLLEKL